SFAEEVGLQLDARDFGTPIIEEVWINGSPCPPASGSISWYVQSARESITTAQSGTGKLLPMVQTTTTWNFIPIGVQWDQRSIRVSNGVGSGAFAIEVAARVRDTSAPVGSPRSIRTA